MGIKFCPVLRLVRYSKKAFMEGIIEVKPEQNFLKLNPTSKQLANVTGLVLDPSCSGSGIVGRDEGGITVHLPSTNVPEPPSKNSRKRKRNDKATKEAPVSENDETNDVQEEQPEEAPRDSLELAKRLVALSDFQLRLLQHAMSFSSARRITYSTCSIHGEENEGVVVRALLSDVAKEAGWRVMKRDEQVDGMRRWHRRGDVSAVEAALQSNGPVSGFDNDEVAAACIRCDKSTEDGTMGFFVAGFVRDESAERPALDREAGQSNGNHAQDDSDEDEEEWGGFSD